MGRSPYSKRCPATRKTQFRSYEQAAKVAGRVDSDAQVYRCSHCGFYHMTSYDRAAYDRRQAKRKSSSGSSAEVADAS